MEGGIGHKQDPQPPTGAWPAEVWLAGEEPKEGDQAEHAQGNVLDKLEDVKEKLGSTVEDVKEALDPKLEKAQGKFGQIFDKISKRLVRKK
jgi:hypothetical protein